jgi:hypothetical protein
MRIARSVADVLRDHVVLEYEAIDRMYLNVYVPHLQTVGATVGYLRVHHGQRFASTTAVAPMSEAFVRNIEQFVAAEGIDLIAFEKGQRKDDVTQRYLRKFKKTEGALYVGKAQEKARVMRTQRRRCSRTGATYPWVVQSTAMVNYYYFYGVDEDFGPFFLKFCSYFPYNAKLCINGHEYLKRQLAKRGVAFQELDNGIKSCANPKLLQRLADEMTAEKIDRLLRKWLRRLPHPFPARDRAAGYRYQLSILQAEFSLTQVLDQPVTGRIFFEEVIRENLDIGRPSQVSLIFDRKINRRTPGRFRTRVITDGVVPSLHIDYKKSRIKQYHKLLEALRTETTINDTRDFGIGRRIENLAELRKIGFAPTDVSLTSNASVTIALLARQRFRTCKNQRSSATSAQPHCASPIRAFRLSCKFCSCSFSSRAHSLTSTFASILLRCWGKSPADSPRDVSPMICVGCVCTALSSASPRPTVTGLPLRDCASPSSTHVSITARCAPVWR